MSDDTSTSGTGTSGTGGAGTSAPGRQGSGPAGAAESAGAAEGRASRIAQAVGRRAADAAGLGGLREQVATLTERVEELEAEVRECRRHHLRTAELTDVVQALLVPIARQDEAGIEQVLHRYTEQLG